MGDWPISDRLCEYLSVQYELLRVLGSGGMGTVVLGRERALERMVAIKVLHRDKSADGEARERFRREARAAAKLTHPNIVPLFTFGEVEGELYFVMGYVEGETLAAHLEREGRLPAERAATLLTELADALEYAHRAGIVHRDLKPENILIDRTSGRAMLTDFGIAREMGAEAALTSTGVIVGTPHYMSPEQASGERALDGRSDLYSLGVIGYRMLAGAVPFQGTNVREVIVQHLTAAATPLPSALRDEHPALVGAVERALAKRPDGRWGSGAAFAQAIRAGTEEEELPEVLEKHEGLYARLVLMGAAVGWAVALIRLAGASTDPWPVVGLVAVGTPVFTTLMSWAGLRGVQRRHPELAPELQRVGLRPPRWWPIWWPRRYRRPGDVWHRLPPELRVGRWVNAFMLAVALPLNAVAISRMSFGESSLAFAHWTAQNPRGWLWIVLGTLGVIAPLIGTFGYLGFRLRKRLGIELRQLPQQPLSSADPRWRHPRFSVLLAPAGAHASAPLTTESLIAALRRDGVALPDGLTDALDSVRAGEAALERELTKLRELVDTEATIRVERRLADLGEGDAELRAILESQRALLQRAQARMQDLEGLRTRLTEQQVLLRQQLLALREAAPSGAGLEEITGRIRALNADLRRLAEGISEAGRATA